MISDHLLPGPNEKGWSVEGLKGVARRVREDMCAFSIVFFRGGEEGEVEGGRWGRKGKRGRRMNKQTAE